MSIFIIKIIACITMVLDHVKYAVPETRCFVTQYFGRISFPLFAFLIGEGYCHTKDLQKYCKRLVIFALISQIPFMLFRTLVGEWLMLNIMFTLMLGLVAITIFDKFGDKYYISLPAVAMVVILGEWLNVDYGWYGVLSVFVLYVFRNKKIARIFAFAILNVIYYRSKAVIMTNFISCIFATVPVILLLLYNGQLGRKTKYIYYIFYPVHMIILYFIHLVQGYF